THPHILFSLSLSHTHTHPHILFSLSLTHTHTHTPTHTLLSLSHTHTHTLTYSSLSLSHTHTHTHTHTPYKPWVWHQDNPLQTLDLVPHSNGPNQQHWLYTVRDRKSN